MTPIESTKKSLKSVIHKLDWFKDSSISLNVSGVLFAETVEEALERLHAAGTMTWKEIVKQVARGHGLTGSEVYSRSLPLRKKSSDARD